MNTANAVPAITCLNLENVEAAETDVSKSSSASASSLDVRRQEAMRLLLNGFNVASLDGGVVAAKAQLV